MEQHAQDAGACPLRHLSSSVGGWAGCHARRHSAGCYPPLSFECRGLDKLAGACFRFASAIFVGAAVSYLKLGFPFAEDNLEIIWPDVCQLTSDVRGGAAIGMSSSASTESEFS